MSRISLLLFLTLLTAAGCGDRSPSPTNGGLPMTTLRIGQKTFTLEIAATDASRQKGLMKRDSMPADHGMIFVFDEEEERRFWMHNTRIPLDILYLASDGRIVSIKTMEPYDERGTPSDGPAQYAIELNAGVAATTGVKVGDRLEIPLEAKRPRQ